MHYKTTTAITGKANISSLKISQFSNNGNNGTFKVGTRLYAAVRISKNAFALTGEYCYC